METRQLNIRVDPAMKKIMECLASDNAAAFVQFLRRPETAKKAIERVLNMRVATFVNVRVLTLWHLLRGSQVTNIDMKEDDKPLILSYLYEPIKTDEALAAETRSHLINATDDPSWVWLDALKKFWAPEMAEPLQTKIRQIGSSKVSRVVTPLVTTYHQKNRPFRKFSEGNEAEVTIPSAWYRTLLYPMLGGEPRGSFDDTPMGYQETLSSIFSSFTK